jgi:DNA modification methylase
MIEIRDNIERRLVVDLVPYARNSRTHSDTQVDQIAASIREWGWTNPVLVDERGGIIAGHGRILGAQRLGMLEVPVLVASGWTEDQKRAYVIADNKLAENAGWDDELLAAEMAALKLSGFDLQLTGFDADELLALLKGEGDGDGDGAGQDDGKADEIPPLATVICSQAGDVWQLGEHRVMCGDSTSKDDVERLMAGAKAQLIHADPPYGMGKEADGVENDNIYGADLDAFQMAWWHAFRPHVDNNGSAYIWGNAEGLWRLWFAGGLGSSEPFEMRNEIVWDKKSIAGMKSPDMLCYPVASERCLFFQFGNQFIGNVNTDDFPASWEPLLGYMAGEAAAAGIRPPDVKRVCGCGMFSHWFTRAQFTLIPEKHYAKLASEYPGQFLRPWAELKREWAAVRGRGRDVINGKLEGVRSYFDNAHEVMRDVWEFPRVSGEERYGHATPKPVSMMVRALTSASSEGSLTVEPFGGSGATLIGAEKAGRVCYTMELQGKYVDVIVRRWQAFTGKTATHADSGEAFDTVANGRA